MRLLIHLFIHPLPPVNYIISSRSIYRATGTRLLRRYRSGGGSHHGAPVGVDGGGDDGGRGRQHGQEASGVHRPRQLGESEGNHVE